MVKKAGSTCADVTRAACGLTSALWLEPYLKGKQAPVDAAGGLGSWEGGGGTLSAAPQWLLFRPHVPQAQTGLLSASVLRACVRVQNHVPALE